MSHSTAFGGSWRCLTLLRDMSHPLGVEVDGPLASSTFPQKSR